MLASFSQLQGAVPQLSQVPLSAVAEDLEGNASLDSLPPVVMTTHEDKPALLHQYR